MRRRLVWALPALIGLVLAACSDLSRRIDLILPDAVRGLPDEGLRALPIRAWLAEKDVTAEALAGCIAEPCPLAAAIGVFRADGQSAAALRSAIRDPASLRTELTARRRASASWDKGTAVAVEPFAAGALRGFVVTMRRRDGERPVTGIVLARTESIPLRFVLGVAEDDRIIQAAESVARASLF